jgi:hypothetical protein
LIFTARFTLLSIPIRWFYKLHLSNSENGPQKATAADFPNPEALSARYSLPATDRKLLLLLIAFRAATRTQFPTNHLRSALGKCPVTTKRSWDSFIVAELPFRFTGEEGKNRKKLSAGLVFKFSFVLETFMKRNLFTAALLTLLSGFFAAAIAAPDQNPRGIYIYSWDIAIDNPPPPVCESCPSSRTQDLVNSLALPGVDGLTLVVDWSIIEPRPGLYQWDLTNVADWSSSTTYVRGDAVSYNSDIYLSLTNGNRQRQPNKAVNNWQLVGCLNQPCKVGGTSPNLLDQWIALAASLGKSVNLAVRAGGGNTGLATPCWLYDQQKSPQCGAGYTGASSQATALQFDVSAHQGVGKCVAETIAAPWDSSFLIEWNAMLAALSTHLQTTIVNNAREYDVVSMIRLTGINRTTDEFRLPEQMPNTLGSCTKATPPIQPIPSIQQWLYPPAALVAYRPSVLIDPNSQTGAWVDITNSFATNFPGKDFNVAIIPDKTGSGQNSGIPQYPFPEIDDNGCVYSPPLTTADIDQYLTPRPCIVTSSIPDQNKHLLSQASQTFPGHLAIEFESCS